MTIREYIRANPKPEGMKPHDYFIEVGKAMGVSPTSVGKPFYQERKRNFQEMEVTRQTFDKDGNLKSEVHALKYIPTADTTGMRKRKVSVSNMGIEWVQYEPEDIEYALLIDRVVEKHLSGREFRKFKKVKGFKEKCCIAVMSDAHVGLEPSTGIFEYEWNKHELNKCTSIFFNAIISKYDLHGRFESLFIDDLGDSMDGYNALTTRGGHSLEQNMTDSEAFDAYVDARVDLIENILDADIADSITIRSVCNDNHSGEFGKIANLTIKKLIEKMYPDRVQFKLLDRFMESFRYGKHVDILTHGKDKAYMKGGFPLILNHKVESFINKYIDHYNLEGYIHIHKGDLHQIGYSRTKRFDYISFMSFAPPSGWVQTNFSDTYSGFSILVRPKFNNEVDMSHVFFDARKKGPYAT